MFSNTFTLSGMYFVTFNNLCVHTAIHRIFVCTQNKVEIKCCSLSPRYCLALEKYIYLTIKLKWSERMILKICKFLQEPNLILQLKSRGLILRVTLSVSHSNNLKRFESLRTLPQSAQWVCTEKSTW